METLTATYSEDELAWVTPETELERDIYLMITLRRPGKIVIRQRTSDGHWPKVPIPRHRDMKSFKLRVEVEPVARIQLFTSEEPERIEYAYI